MTARAVSRMLVVAGALAILGLALTGVLTSRLIDLRVQVAAAARDCSCCPEVDRP